MIYFLFSTKIRRVVVCWGWALSCCPYLRISTLPLSAGDRLTESQERCASFFEVEGTIFKWFLLSPLLFRVGSQIISARGIIWFSALSQSNGV